MFDFYDGLRIIKNINDDLLEDLFEELKNTLCL